MAADIKVEITPRTLHFKQPAGTSRGVYNTRLSHFVTVTDSDGNKGIGECAPLPDLSCDARGDYFDVLRKFCNILEDTGCIPYEDMLDFPSMLFGLETAMLSLKRKNNALFDTPFGHGEEGIPINGLVWMGSFEEMMQRIEQKINDGFTCIKLKIGAIDFENEMDMVKHIRARFSKEDIMLRVDANGGFTPEDALQKLERLSKFDIHSIEQPIRQGQWEDMARLCSETPLPIAFDEELIGINSTEDKLNLLDTLRPQYIVLKPSLHGGMRGTREWIKMADERGIGSWITSALESNIGLNAIAHLTADIYGSNITNTQGLGTGMLFTDNIPMPIEIRKDKLWFSPNS